MEWARLAARLGVLSERGEATNDSDYRRALEILVGEEVIRSAVDVCIEGGVGMSVARGVLSRLESPIALRYCYEIYRTTQDPEAKRAAVELLRDVGDRDTLGWIPGFLADADAGVQVWGIEVAEALLWRGHVEDADLAELLEVGARHTNLNVRNVVERIRDLQVRRSR